MQIVHQKPVCHQKFHWKGKNENKYRYLNGVCNSHLLSQILWAFSQPHEKECKLSIENKLDKQY